jgi:hypothetical protein
MLLTNPHRDYREPLTSIETAKFPPVTMLIEKLRDSEDEVRVAIASSSKTSGGMGMQSV